MYDVNQLKTLYKSGFPEDSDEFVDFFFAEYSDLNKVVAKVVDGEIISATHLINKKIFLRGSVFEFPFFVAVATLPHLRGQKIVESVILDAFGQIIKDDYCFAGLYPFSHSYYTKYNFVTCAYTNEVMMDYLPNGARKFTPTASQLDKMFCDHAVTFDAYQIRDKKDWHSLTTDWQLNARPVTAYAKDGKSCYYVDNGEGYEVIGDYSLLIADKSLKGATLDVGSGDGNTPSTMFRILNVKKTLESITFDCEGELSFNLIDTFYPNNSGKYMLTAHNGKGKVERTQNSSTDTVITVEQLTQAVFGRKTHTPLDKFLQPLRLFFADKY